MLILSPVLVGILGVLIERFLLRWIYKLDHLYGLLLTFGLNAMSARGFGEAEFWFALIKVIAVLAFVAMGVMMLLGIIRGGEAGGLENWTVGDAPFAGGFAALIGVAMVVAVVVALVAAALGAGTRQAGPVHLNLPYRDPLAGAVRGVTAWVGVTLLGALLTYAGTLATCRAAEGTVLALRTKHGRELGGICGSNPN